ncbi:RDD family protein [Rathayibacter sp. VKM Ac-2857]|uniref:RDD family protein n=1 Tax=Rathayibacter sp. VKM Ac-2857 TaxID=2739020 RepID=UPI001566AD7A|nr:RDD family protein [Rathayibacter sp. VKM Ac-2857]NQX16056.1 RDD family protein [Rathayibacter sp. VKM Ac-2857]
MTDTTTSGWVCSRCSTTMDASAAFCRGCGAPALSAGTPRRTAAVPFGVPAALGPRVGAYLLDSVIVGAWFFFSYVIVWLLTWALWQTASSTGAYSAIAYFGAFGPAVLILAFGLFYTKAQGGRGTPGMRMLGLRLVRYDSGEEPGFWKAAGRNVVFNLCAAIIVGYFSPLFDTSGENRGWHDQATGTWMIDTRSAGAVRPAATVREVPAPTSSVAVVADLDEPVVPRTPAETSVAPAAYSAPAAVAPATAVSAAYSAPAVAPASFSAPPAGVISAVPGSAAPARPTAPAHEPEDLELTRMSAGAPAQPRPRAVRLRFDDGTVVVVSDTALVGRNPTPRTGEAAGELVALADTTRSISKTHARLEFLGDELSVIDRHSTNGTGVVIDGTATPVPPGGRAAVPVGATLTFGDRTAAVEWA